MYWITVGNDISAIYNKLINTKSNTLNALNTSNITNITNINGDFSNIIKKIKKNDTYNIESYILSRDNKNSRVSVNSASKSIKKQLIRHINSSYSSKNDYIVLPISDFSFGINILNDFDIKYMIFIKNQKINIIHISNILGFDGYEFKNQLNNNIYEFTKNIKKFNIKIFINLSDNFENNIYYKIYTGMSNVTEKATITFIKSNLLKFSPQNIIKFNIILFNFILSKINCNDTFLDDKYFDF
jgi:hypothetical protein